EGILSVREKFSGFTETQSVAGLGAQAKIDDAGDVANVPAQRAMITTQAPGSSGGGEPCDRRRAGGGAGAAAATAGAAARSGPASRSPARRARSPAAAAARAVAWARATGLRSA